MPPDQTNAENFYYVKQMQSKTPMAITLKDGEILKGVIEWYDRSCLKVNRDGAPNLLLYKSNIKYMYQGRRGVGIGRASRRRADAEAADIVAPLGRGGIRVFGLPVRSGVSRLRSRE